MKFQLREGFARFHTGHRALGTDWKHCTLKAGGEHVTITLTSAEVQYECRLAANVSEAGECSLPAQTFAALARLPSTDEVPSFELEPEGWLHLLSTLGEFRVRAALDADTPRQSISPPPGHSRVINLKDREDLANAAAKRADDGALAGVHFADSHIMATDRYRFARLAVDVDFTTPFTLPSRVFRLLCRLGQPISVGIGSSLVVAESSDVRVETTLIPGPFPVKKLLQPSLGPSPSVVDRHALLSILDLMSAYNARSVELQADAKNLVAAYADDTVQLALPTSAQGGRKWKVTVDLRFLKDALSLAASDDVKLDFVASERCLDVADDAQLFQRIMMQTV